MIVVDVETSGLDPNKHSILSIGAVDFQRPERSFYGECRAWDGALIQEEALEINGFTVEQATDKNKKTLQELMREFKSWVDESKEITLAGQNPSFDRDFLNNSFWRTDIDFKFAARNVDLHSVAYYDHITRGIDIPQKNNHSDLSLDNIAKYAGLTEEPKPHNALNGAKFEAEALSRIIHGKSILPEFNKFEIPKFLKQ
jgi:DNA polymerase-3 subunit epsilon